MIKTIVFDYADVICPGPLSAWNMANLTPSDERIPEYRQNSRRWDLGQMDLNEMYKYLEKLTKTPANQIWEKFYKPVAADEKMIMLIKKLKLNYKIILFSNFVSKQIRSLLEKQGITSLFDELIISSEYGLMKPDPRFFDVLVKKADVKKREIFYTDDSLKNIEAANAYGIKAYQFVTAPQLIRDLAREGVNIND